MNNDFRAFHRAILELERTIRALQSEDAYLLSGTIIDLESTKKHLEFMRDNFCIKEVNHLG
jgi:hypothetical protein